MFKFIFYFSKCKHVVLFNFLCLVKQFCELENFLYLFTQFACKINRIMNVSSANSEAFANQDCLEKSRTLDNKRNRRPSDIVSSPWGSSFSSASTSLQEVMSEQLAVKLHLDDEMKLQNQVLPLEKTGLYYFYSLKNFGFNIYFKVL